MIHVAITGVVRLIATHTVQYVPPARLCAGNAASSRLLKVNYFILFDKKLCIFRYLAHT